MKFIRQCKNCEFNTDNICYNGGDVYDYGEKITDDSKLCDEWEPDLDYYIYTKNNAPRFLREQLEDCSISYGKFYNLLEAFDRKEAVSLNIFDAIKYIYGISMVDIAVALGVTFGVVYNAKTKKIPEKRIHQFANGLCIPEKFLFSISTQDFNELEKCKEKFLQEHADDVLNIPDWEKSMVAKVSQTLQCPIHIAKEIYRVDKMYWDIYVVENKYTNSEMALIKYLTRNNKKGIRTTSIEYSLDRAGYPHIRYEIHDEQQNRY